MNEPIELDWLKRWATYRPHRIALVDGASGDNGQHCNIQWSYKHLYDRCLKGAEYLAKHCLVQKGDRVALLAQNEIDSFVLFFACQRLGAILVPINFRFTQREVNHVLQDCQPKVLVGQKAYHHLFENAPPELRPQTWLDLTGEALTESPSFQSACDGDPVNEGAGPQILGNAERFPTDFNDPVMILYTSGTTGAPKGALLTHKSLYWNSINTGLSLDLTGQDCAVIFLPLFHTGGWNVLSTPLFHHGGKVILTKKFDPSLVLQLCESEGATILFGVPTTMDLMARAPKFAKANLAKIRYAIVGGEPMPVELIRTWQNRGILIRQGYGLTEFGPNVFSLGEHESIRKIGSIGFPNFYIETKVIDEFGNALPPNQIGELCLRGPMCMAGYWNHPAATAETIVDGWLRTGDLVRYDEEGFFYVMGRKKEMYISGGENVYPVEIEQVLSQLEGVREAAVVGVPDPKWGEVGKAFLVREDSDPSTSTLSLDTVHAHCLSHLAKFKIPKYFQFVDSIPKGESGKILKRQLQS